MKPCEIKMYELKVKDGTYKSDTLFSLMWAVFYHRLHHWKKGEGFKD
jgi:hypothetical protein|tara:strand:- start:114 stop:254 length:141 start_codon:yes stop_codon:yes gene_type:complete